MKLQDPVLCPDKRLGVVSDSAFPCSGEMVGWILTPLKDGDIDRVRSSLRSKARTLHNAITSVRQAAEWGSGVWVPSRNFTIAFICHFRMILFFEDCA
jgi:hypothetical protein